jgi:hypothetical protein
MTGLEIFLIGFFAVMFIIFLGSFLSRNSRGDNHINDEERRDAWLHGGMSDSSYFWKRRKRK